MRKNIIFKSIWLNLFLIVLINFYTSASFAEEKKGLIVVGSKEFTEQLILGKILARFLENQGYQIQEQPNLSLSKIRDKILNKEIDVCWEYTGTAYMAYHFLEDAKIYTNPQLLHETVKKVDDVLGLVWLKPTSINNTWAFAMQKSQAQQLNIHNISQLAEAWNQKKPLRLGLTRTFYERNDGFKKLMKYYQFNVDKSNLTMWEHSGIHAAVARGQFTVGMVYGTDPQIKQFDLEILEDDKHFFPIYAPTPVIRKEFLDKYPELESLINQLPPLLTQESMIELNYKVDFEHKTLEDVALTWLKQQNLVK